MRVTLRSASMLLAWTMLAVIGGGLALLSIVAGVQDGASADDVLIMVLLAAMAVVAVCNLRVKLVVEETELTIVGPVRRHHFRSSSIEKVQVTVSPGSPATWSLKITSGGRQYFALSCFSMSPSSRWQRFETPPPHAPSLIREAFAAVSASVKRPGAGSTMA